MNTLSSVQKRPPANIFVIDDNPDMVSLITTILSDAGYGVDGATDPVAALEKQLPFKPDIILIDLNMPKISGYELIESLRDACRSQEIKIITVSALRDEEAIDRAFQAGTNDYLAKPFSNEELLQRISRQLQSLKEESASTLSKTPDPSAKRPAEPEREPIPPSPEIPEPDRTDTIMRAPKAAPPRAKVLIVDDDPDMRGLVSAILTEKGHRVIEAANGEEGLALADRDDPDLIVLDILMPGLDGYEVCRRLADQPHTAHIPILMLTAKSSLEDMEIGLSGYADDYMTKPFQQRELVARAGALIRRTQRPKRPQRAKQDPIQQLVDRAAIRGGDVYSPHVSRLENHPPQWTGPVPDVLVVRGKKRIAYWIETVESLRDEKTPSRWKALLKMKGIELRLIVTDTESHKAASSLLRRHRLNVKLLNTDPSRSGDSPQVRRPLFRIRTAIVLTVLAGFFFALLFMWGISRIPE